MLGALLTAAPDASGAAMQEDEGDEEEEAAEAEKEALAKEKKKKVLKPPGYKKPPLPKPRVKQEEGAAAAGGGAGPATGAGAPRRRKSSIGPEDFTVERRTVRESTRQKVEEGEMERKLAEKVGDPRGLCRLCKLKTETGCRAGAGEGVGPADIRASGAGLNSTAAECCCHA